MTKKREPEVTIITGLSGAGKSQAVATFEDAGYFCIDNMPPQMLTRVTELFSLEGSRVERLALVFDVRGGSYFERLEEALRDLKAAGARPRIVFLEAEEDALVARYQETRRIHPLDEGGRLREGIRREKELLADLRSQADLIVDTTGLNVHQLGSRLRETVLAGDLEEAMYVTFLSFGYKYGVPTEADIVLDARFLPNPHWIEEMRPLSGRDQEVKDYVLGHGEAHGFIERVADLLRFLVPAYLKEDKIQLVVAVGCTGGRHRSVSLVEELAVRLDKLDDVVGSVRHRDVDRQS